MGDRLCLAEDDRNIKNIREIKDQSALTEAAMSHKT